MGFSHLHSSKVPLVLNLDTGSTTPQYHVVFDDHFSTVSSVERENDPPDNWTELCLDNTTYIPSEAAPPTMSVNGPTALPGAASLDFEWLTPTTTKQEWATRAMTRQDAICETMVQPTTISTAPTTTPSTTTPSPASASKVLGVSTPVLAPT
jgi:hypothetical protein